MKDSQCKKTKSVWFIQGIAILIALRVGSSWAHEDVVLECDTQNAYEKGGTHQDIVFRIDGPHFYDYQWFKGGDVIPGETKRKYKLSNITNDNAGTYSVAVATGDQVLYVRHVNLFVYESTSRGTNKEGVLVANGGTLTAPVGVFTAGTYACEGGGTFSHGYSLCGSGGVPQLFYGRGFPLASQEPPFINNGFDNIKVFTVNQENPGLIGTAVRIQNNWFSLPPNAWCAPSPAGSTGTDVTKLLNSASGVSKNTYRGTIFYNGTPTTSVINFHWLYFN